MSKLASEMIQEFQKERELKSMVITQVLSINDVDLLIKIKDFISSKELENG